LRIILIFAVVSLSACTSVNVKPVDPSLSITSICIRHNPKVEVDDFVQVLRNGFWRHGIASDLIRGRMPKGCEYILNYTALRSWDMATYLSHAELWLEKDGKQIASAEYHLVGKGGLSLTKWAGTKEKMYPVIDELLTGR